MTDKVALITGVSGQDGSYLAEFLLSKGYTVHGIIRRASQINTQRLNKIYRDPHDRDVKFFLHYGDLSDPVALENLVFKVRPDEIYNLGAMSHVKVSFEIPEYTADIDGLGTLRLLETIRKMDKPVRFYQAGTSEMYGGLQGTELSETTPFDPRSPYAAAKVYAYWITRNYREAYGIFASNGILFNHTSPRRGETFVESKIVRAVVAIVRGDQDCLYLGNLYAKRDFGFAGDYVKAMWMMLQQDEPDDYVVATGQEWMVKDIVDMTFAHFDKKIEWKGEGVDEVGMLRDRVLVRIDPQYFRPTEVPELKGNYEKIKAKCGWEPEKSFPDVLKMMIYDEVSK